MPSPRSRALSWIGRWGTADVTDPRPTQSIFALLFLADWLAQGGVGGSGSGWAEPFTVAAILALTGASWACPWASWTETSVLKALAVVAFGDILAVGVHFSSAPASASIVLIGMPALWLGRVGYSGIAACGLAVVGGVLLPACFYSGTALPGLLRGLLPALVALLVTTAKAAAVERDRYERRVMEALVETVDVGLQLVDTRGRTLRSNGRVPAQPPAGRGDDLGGQGGRMTLKPLSYALDQATRGELVDGLLVPVDDVERSVFSVSARPVHDADGRQVAAALAWQDVTPLVDALNEDRHLLATVSHDLRTPLTAIRGYVEILATQFSTPEAARMLDIIRKNSERIEFLIGDLVLAADTRRDSSALTRAPVDLVALVREAIATVQPIADQAAVTITAVLPSRLMVELDADRFHQVIDNLLSNAVKYNSPGGRVDIALGLDPEQLHLSVSDDGIGIPRTAIQHIFDRHYRVEDVRDSFAGSGLGLSIVKDVVDAHHGTLSVVSEPGEGSQFTITLPR